MQLLGPRQSMGGAGTRSGSRGLLKRPPQPSPELPYQPPQDTWMEGDMTKAPGGS